MMYTNGLSTDVQSQWRLLIRLSHFHEIQADDELLTYLAFSRLPFAFKTYHEKADWKILWLETMTCVNAGKTLRILFSGRHRVVIAFPP